MVVARSSETDTRLNILNTLLTTPHRKLENVYPVHAEMIKADPLFYVRLAAWYNDTGEVRDHKEMFIINLCLSDFEGHRDVGLALYREMPPYQLERIANFIHGTKKTKKVVNKATKAVTETVENFGLGKRIPNSMKTETARYLHEREAEPEWFDTCVLTARRSMRRLYGLMQIPPLSDRMRQILFYAVVDGKKVEGPPEDSKLFAVKQLIKATSPAEQAKAIIENKIPYRIASTVVSAMTPTVLLALIEVMSDQELINNIGSLKRRGVFDNADLKALVEKRLDKAKTGKRVAALKGQEAIKAAGVSEDIQKKLEEVSDTQIKARGVIKRDTAILIDKSGSMTQAIELGKQIAAMVSAISTANLYVYAFDTMAYPVVSQGKDLASWEKALRGITANGGTSCGVALEYMIRGKQSVEQIILITDEGENQTPAFCGTLKKYKDTLKVDPGVVIVKTQGASNQLEQEAVKNGLQVDAWQFSGDYYALPGLISFLTKGSKLDLLMDIMMYPLPVRKSA